MSASRRRGVSFIEMALTVPVLLVLVLSMVQYGRMSYSTEVVTNLAREGARFGSQGSKIADADIAQYVLQQAASSYIAGPGLVVQVRPLQNTPERIKGAPITVSVSYDLSQRMFIPAGILLDRYRTNQVNQDCAQTPGSCWVYNPQTRKSQQNNSPATPNAPMYSAVAEMRMLSEATPDLPPPAVPPPPPPSSPTPASPPPTSPPPPPPPPSPTSPPSEGSPTPAPPQPTTPPPTPRPTPMAS